MNIEVNMGNISVASDGVVEELVSNGIGSCLIVTLYDPKHKRGALAHAMLSGREQKDTRYVSAAIDTMVEKLVGLGSKIEDLEAKLTGAANMFPSCGPDTSYKIVQDAKEKLKEKKIKLIGECVGGNQGRSVVFNIASGLITVKTRF